MVENNLIGRIRLIIESLKSKELLDLLNQWNLDKYQLLTMIIESKIGYDTVIADQNCRKFIEDIEEYTIYSISEYSQLIIYIASLGESGNRLNINGAILNKFQIFHKMVYKASTLVIKLLSETDSTTQQPVSSSSNFSESSSHLRVVSHTISTPTLEEQEKVTAVPVQTSLIVTDKNVKISGHEVSEMTLNSFLRSIALLDIPSESLV